ncbi:MAG: OmpA family protein [Planctomycetota bacterium]
MLPSVGMVLAAFSFALGGCAANPKNNVSDADQRNRALASELAKARGEIDAATREREELNRRLLAAQRESGDLRAQLANAPVPTEEPAPGWTAVPGGAMISIEENVLFAVGKIALRDQAKKTLDAVASTIQGQYADKDILVFGHTDNQPIKKSGWDDNWQLSTERSLSVVRYLKERGIMADRLVAAGCGEHRPKADNASDKNRSANRRVEIFAIDPQARTGRK